MHLRAPTPTQAPNPWSRLLNWLTVDASKGES